MACPRAALEQLVLRSLQTKTHVALSDVEAACKPPDPVAQVTVTHDGFANAGLFSLLPPDVMIKIVDQLGGLKPKLTFSIEVCKGLRTLQQMPELWMRISTTNDGENAGRYCADCNWINGKGFLRLARWMPDRDKVADLMLFVSKGTRVFAPDDVSEALRLFPNVATLRLSGKAVVKKVLVSLGRTDRPHLRHLTLDWPTSLGVATILDVLKRAPNLQTLEAENLSGELMTSYAAQMREARGGGVPLLTRLFHTSRWSESLNIFDASRLGSLFPELTDLSLTLCERGPSPSLPTKPLEGANLLRLEINRMSHMFGRGESDVHLSSSSCSAMIGILTANCPRLESLLLKHGIQYQSTCTNGVISPPLPRLQAAFQQPKGLPRSLVMLHLGDILVAPEDFIGVDLPNLVLVRLVNGGLRAAATSAALLDNDKCPKLTARGIIHRGIKISSDSVPARTLKEHSPWRFALEFQTPRGSLAGLSLDGVVKVLQENTRTAMDVSLFDD